MATVAYKQGIILERFWTALRLRRSKGSSETNNLIKFRSGDRVWEASLCKTKEIWYR